MSENINTASCTASGTGTGTGTSTAEPRREQNLLGFQEYNNISQSHSVPSRDFDMISGDPLGLLTRRTNAAPSAVAAAAVSYPISGREMMTGANLLELDKNDDSQELVDSSSTTTMTLPNWHATPVECFHPEESSRSPPPHDFLNSSSVVVQDKQQQLPTVLTGR